MGFNIGASMMIFIACLICYYNSLQCGFVFDDISAVKDNKDLRPHTPLKNLFFNDFWGTPMQKEQSHKSYRPLCVLTFRFNYLFHQLEPMGYHLVNVLLHSVASIMYLKMCSMFIPEMFSFIASLLFAVHPVHTEAVTGVVGRAETLSCIFFLGAFMSYAKCAAPRHGTAWRHMLLTLLFVTAAMLSKEQGITVIGVCAVYELFIIQKLRIWELLEFVQWVFSGKACLPPWLHDAITRISVLVFYSIFLLMARVHVMGAQLPVFTRFDNPASVSPTPVRQLTYNYLLSVNAWLLLFPCDLCCDWTMGTIRLIESFLDPRNLATVAFYAVLAKLVYTGLMSPDRKQRNVILMSLAFIFFPFLPASNLFFPVGFVVAERILYAPSLGLCMLVAYGWSRLVEKGRCRKIAWLALCFLILVHGLKTIVRNQDWMSEYTIFMGGLKVNRNNAKLFNNVGHALESQGRFLDALDYFQKAVEVQKDDIGAHINVGRTFNNLKMYSEAEVAYLKAKSLLPKAKPGETYQARIAPNHLNVFLNLANLIARNETRLEEADMLYRQAIAMRSDYTQAYINRGDILIKLNRTKEAQEVYEKALFYDNNNPDIYYNLGVVFLEQGKAPEALAYLDKALEFDPDHQQALMNSAILIQESGNAELRDIAYQRLLKLLSKDESNERVYFNLGMLSMDDKDEIGAERWFKKAVQLKPDFRSALFNLALLLSDGQRPLEAAPFLNQLLKYHPDHIKGLILLGDIYINNIKDLDGAERCYQRILELDPGNVQGLHNLCVVYVERGDLLAAENCFDRAHQLAPNEDYILRHLKIVRSKLRKSGGSPAPNSASSRRPAPTDSNNHPAPSDSNNRPAPSDSNNRPIPDIDRQPSNPAPSVVARKDSPSEHHTIGSASATRKVTPKLKEAAMLHASPIDTRVKPSS